MHPHTPRHEDDLNDLESRLSGWRPGNEGLDAAAMLYAAGVAEGRRGRSTLLWPAACVLLAGLAAGLGGWGLAERAERQALASRLRDRAPTPRESPATAVAVVPEPFDRPSPDGYLSLRRRMEQDPNRWLAPLQPEGPLPTPPPEPAILHGGQRDGTIDP
jgi:hypothetical protein